MSLPTFALTDSAELLSAALVRMNDAIRVLEAGASDVEARADALRILKGGAA